MFVPAKENRKGSMIRTTALLAAVLSFGVAVAAAGEDPTPVAGTDRCAPFAASAAEVKKRMYAFEPTFGKDPMLWTDADYDAIAKAASTCDGVVEKGRRISAGSWTSVLREVKNRVYPVAVANRTAASYAPVGRIRLPDCRRMPDYRVDPESFVDNSSDLFGIDLFSMTDAEIDGAVGYANICRAVIPIWLGVSRDMLVGVALESVETMMDRFLLLRMRRDEWRSAGADGLVLSLPNGAQVPPTMTSAPVRELVVAFDQWGNSGYYQSPNTMSRLLAILSAAEKASDGPFDRLYVDKIRTFVQDRMLNP